MQAEADEADVAQDELLDAGFRAALGQTNQPSLVRQREWWVALSESLVSCPTQELYHHADGAHNSALNFPHRDLSDLTSKGATEKEGFIQCRELLAFGHRDVIETALPLRNPYMRWGSSKGGAQRNDHHIVGEPVADIQRDDEGRTRFAVAGMTG